MHTTGHDFFFSPQHAKQARPRKKKGHTSTTPRLSFETTRPGAQWLELHTTTPHTSNRLRPQAFDHHTTLPAAAKSCAGRRPLDVLDGSACLLPRLIHFPRASMMPVTGGCGLWHACLVFSLSPMHIHDRPLGHARRIGLADADEMNVQAPPAMHSATTVTYTHTNASKPGISPFPPQLH